MFKISVSLTWTSDNVSHDLFNSRYIVAENIGMNSMCPLKCKCANECRLLTIGKMEVIVDKGRSRASGR